MHIRAAIRAGGRAALTRVDGLEGLEPVDLEAKARAAGDGDTGGPFEDPHAGAGREHLGEGMGGREAAGAGPDDGHVCTGSRRIYVLLRQADPKILPRSKPGDGST